jgi:hypothetical protein
MLTAGSTRGVPKRRASMPGGVGESPSAVGGSSAPTTGSAPMNLNRQLDKNTTLVSSFTREQVRQLLVYAAVYECIALTI